MRERACATASALVLEDERVVVLLSEISVPLFREAQRAHPERVVNVGIMEQALIGVAAGWAMEGFLPIVHTLAPFLVERPFEQLKDDFGYQCLGGTFISVGASYDYSTEGTTHHAPGDVALLCTIPGFEILVPGTAYEAERLIRATYANGRPTYVRTSTRENERSFEICPGVIEVVRTGARATVIAVGSMLRPTLAATEGLDVTVLYATSVFPFDAPTLRREARDSIVIVEPFLEGTLAPRVVDALEARRPVRIASIGVPRRNLDGYGSPKNLDLVAGLDDARIEHRIRAFIEGPGRADA